MGEPVLGWAVWAFYGAWRLGEVVWARGNLRRLLAEGGRLVDRDGLGLMVVLHVGTMAGSVFERMHGARAGGLVSWLALAALVVSFLGRLWMHRTLGRRWTMRIVVLEDESPIRHGPYRFLRHPNYGILLAEVVALPVFLHAWWTLALLTLPHAWALYARVELEERAWREVASPLP